MKANELMQGYIVLYEYDGQKFPARVIEIYRNSVLVESINGEYEPIEIEEDKIFPAPLSPEILERNGFKWNRYNTSLNLTCGTIHMGYGFYKYCLSVSDWDDDGTTQIVSMECKYLHHLQNILRLCGIEKEIEL